MAKPFLLSVPGILTMLGVSLLVISGVILSSTLWGSRASNWAYEMTGVRDLQDQGLTGKGVRVAIIDTGFDDSHPSLSKINLVEWKDLVNDRPEPYDDVGHGNHVAGILAGQGSSFSGRVQGFNVEGVAPAVGLIAIKAIGADGSGTEADVATGIDFAIDHGADVICLSLGRQEQPLDLVSDRIATAVDDALNRGIHVVAAAGNTGERDDRDDVERPATTEGVIAVGAVDKNRKVAPFSAQGNEAENYGTSVGGTIRTPPTRADPDKKPEVVAPGVEIRSAWKDDQYATAKGTSQAVPFVCGALALLLEAKPTLRSDNSVGVTGRVKTGLMNSAEELPGQRLPHDPRAGYGLLRADRLVQQF